MLLLSCKQQDSRFQPSHTPLLPQAVTVDELVQAYIAENLAVLDGLAASGARRKTISAKDTKLAALKEEAQPDDEIEVGESELNQSRLLVPCRGHCASVWTLAHTRECGTTDETAVAAAAKAAGYLVATDKKTKRTFYHHKETQVGHCLQCGTVPCVWATLGCLHSPRMPFLQKSVWTLPTEVMNDAFVIAVARAASGKKKAAGGGAGAGAGAGVGAASASSMTGLSWWYTDGTGTQQVRLVANK